MNDIMTPEAVLAMSDEELAEALSEIEVPEFSTKFRRVQGAASVAKSDEGRLFSVSGPKADTVRSLVMADWQLTRKEIAELAACSVSRVGEVVWGLQHDAIEFPAIPTRRKAEASDEDAAESDEG